MHNIRTQTHKQQLNCLTKQHKYTTKNTTRIHNKATLKSQDLLKPKSSF